MRIIISEMKNVFDGDNGKLGTEKESIRELKTKQQK